MCLPICRAHQYRRTVTVSISAQITWSCDGECWVAAVTTSEMTTYSGWTPTGAERACSTSSDAGGAAGAVGAGQLQAGDYVLEWAGERIAFTVPDGVSVTLSWRELSNGSSVAVFSLSDGSELVVAADALSGVSGAVAPDDPTLAAIAASLRDPTAAAADTTVTTTSECAVAVRPSRYCRSRAALTSRSRSPTASSCPDTSPRVTRAPRPCSTRSLARRPRRGRDLDGSRGQSPPRR